MEETTKAAKHQRELYFKLSEVVQGQLLTNALAAVQVLHQELLNAQRVAMFAYKPDGQG